MFAQKVLASYLAIHEINKRFCTADGFFTTDRADKRQIVDSMTGYRDTLLFYTYKDQNAVLVLNIGNTDLTFPMTGKVYLFNASTSDEGLEKWINNQHSDGLYPEVPSPIFTLELPENSCRVSAYKEIDQSKHSGPDASVFKGYEVKFSVERHASENRFSLLAFKDTARVFVKQ